MVQEKTSTLVFNSSRLMPNIELYHKEIVPSDRGNPSIKCHIHGGFRWNFVFAMVMSTWPTELWKLVTWLKIIVDSKYNSQFTLGPLGAYPDYEPSSNPSVQWLIVKVPTNWYFLYVLSFFSWRYRHNQTLQMLFNRVRREITRRQTIKETQT